MKTWVPAALALWLCPSLTSGQPLDFSWEWQSPNPQYLLTRIRFLDAKFGYGFGPEGFLAKTSDGGRSWVEISPEGQLSGMGGAHFLNRDTGFAVGTFGPFYRTENGGATWETLPFYTSLAIRSLLFLNASEGFMTGGGGQINMTVDGGGQWLGVGGGDGDYYGIHFPGKDTGYVVGSYSVTLRSVDRGNAWSFVKPPDYSGPRLRDPYFASTRVGFAWGLGDIYKTTDGGVSWDPHILGTGAIHRAAFSDSLNGFIATHRHKFTTRDGAETWDTVAFGDSLDFLSVDYPDAALGFGLGRDKAIWSTTDGGRTHARISAAGARPNLYSICFPDSVHGWSVGQGGAILKTGDAGRTWESLRSGTSRRLNSVSFASSRTGLAVGDSGTILRTRDGGNSWEAISVPTSINLAWCAFTSPTTVFAAGGGGCVLKSSDTGLTWLELRAGDRADYHTGFFLNPNQGMIGGDSGILLRTEDGGNTWTRTKRGSGLKITGISLWAPGDGWISGNFQEVYRIVDGGADWLREPIGVTANAHALITTQDGSRFVVGERGRIYYRLANKDAWTGNSTRNLVFTSLNLNAAAANRLGSIFVAGDSGAIVKLTYPPGQPVSLTDRGNSRRQSAGRPSTGRGTVFCSGPGLCHSVQGRRQPKLEIEP